jgi:hypothetical protein
MNDEALKLVAEEIGRLVDDDDLVMMARSNIDNERQFNLFLEWARAAAKEGRRD